MTIYNWPTTKARSQRATAQFKRHWRCEWCGKALQYSGGWQIAMHKSACHRRPKHDK